MKRTPKIPKRCGVKNREFSEEIQWKAFKRACEIWLIKNGLQTFAEINWRNKTRKKEDL